MEGRKKKEKGQGKMRKDREKRERGRDKEGREEGRYEKGGREKFSFTYGRLLWAWTLGGSPAEVDDVIDLHGNCSRTRTVDGIKLKIGGHIEDGHGYVNTKFGCDQSPRSSFIHSDVGRIAGGGRRRH